MMQRRAFSLLEMMVALAMAGIVAAAAIGAGMAINRVMVDTRRRATVWDEAKRLEEALLSRIQEAGGDPMASFQSVFVEDNCVANVARNLPACAGADRLTILAAKPGFPVCDVEVAGAVLKGVASPCCITADFVGPAVLVRDDGVAVTVSLHTVNLASCQVNAPPGQGNPTPQALGDGKLALITAQTIFPRPKGVNGEYELMMWIDSGTPANGIVEDVELGLFADRVYDFQVALGYDSAPEDGDVVDNGTATDEWLGNAEAIPATLPASIAPSQLRMIDIAVAVGTRAERFTGRPAKLLNRSGLGVNPANVYLAPTRGQIAFRNLNISVP
jgi:prepilin-type N-terminal cleavage/methylation domain-containing protein